MGITEQINSLLVILIFGSLVLLSFLLIVNPLRVNKKANFIFGIFLFIWSTFWIEEILEMTGIGMMGIGSEIGLRYIQFVTPLFFYYAVVFYSNPDYKYGKTDVIYLVLSCLYLFAVVQHRIYGVLGFLPIALNILIIIQALFFIILSYLKIKEHKKKIDLFASKTEEIDLRWLEWIIISLLALCIFIGIYNLLFTAADLNLFANIFCLAIVYFVAIHTVSQKEIFILGESERNQIIASNANSNSEKRKLLSDEDLDRLKFELTEIMETKHPYLDPELSLLQLANTTGITPHQLSYLINEGFNENFFMYVNRFRVEKVKQFLNDEKKKNLAILGIAFESGFNSKTSFYTTFKKITSMTPSEYLKKSSEL